MKEELEKRISFLRGALERCPPAARQDLRDELADYIRQWHKHLQLTCVI